MRHQPKKLALLISLIGAGVSPCANARVQEWADSVAPSPLDVAFDVPVATALDRTRWSPGLAWRTEEGAPDLFELLQREQVVVRGSKDDWAPGEMPQEPQPVSRRAFGPTAPDRPDAALGETSPEPLAEARSASSEPQPAARGRLKRLRALVQAVAAKHLQPAEGSGPPGAADSPVLVAAVVADDRAAAAEPSSAVAAASAEAQAPSVHATRLMESLAAIVLEDLAILSGDAAAARIAERFPAWAAEALAFDAPPVVAPMVALHAPGIERRKIVVAPQSGKVLQCLEAVLSDAMLPFGTVRAEPAETFVATQESRVLATLLEISSARKDLDDPAARRDRKRAAAKARADEAPAVVVPERIHVLRRLSPLTAALHGLRHAEVDIDLTQLTSLEPGAAESAPAASATAPLAMEPPPLPSVAAVPLPTSTAATTASPAANAADVRRSPFGGELVAMSEKSLDRVRGGFVADGLNISFGIERAVYVNGALVTTTSLNVSDLGRITAGRATTSFDTASLGLIQSGPGNSFAPGAMSSASIGTVVQNTLDGQKIQNLTVINATVNSLGFLKGLNLQSSLRGAVIDSLRR